MKKFIIWIVSILAVLAAAYFGLNCWMNSKVQNEISQLKPEQTRMIGNIACILDGHSNMFVIKSAKGYIAIDAGIGTDGTSKGLNALSISPDSVRFVFLTHSDPDHVGALPLFKNAQVYISTDEKQMVDGTTARAPFTHNSIPDGYKTIPDGGEVFADSIRIRGILAPGHTPGSMCFIVSDTIMFTGDALSLLNGKVNKFNEFFTMDMDSHMQSIEKLSKLTGIKHIYTAHYGYSDNFEYAFTK